MRTVDGCPCGEQHKMSDRAWGAYSRANTGRPLTVLVGSGHGAWRVPRVWMAFHGAGLTQSKLRELAGRHGWERG